MAEELSASIAVFLPEEGGAARLLHDRDAPPDAAAAVRALTHQTVRDAVQASVFDAGGLAVDPRALLPGVAAPLRAVRRATGGLVVLLAWGKGARRVPLEAAFEALRPVEPLPFEDVFENAALAMLVVGDDRQLHAANRAGRRLLARTDGLSGSGGRLTAASPKIDARLEAALDEARGAARPVALTIPGAAGAAGLRCELGRIDRPLAQAEGAARILLTAAPATAEVPVEEILAQRFGLTGAEARLAGHLVAGRDLRRAGEVMGVSRHTARKYLQIAFSKMGVRRQADLVRLALQLSQEAVD